MDYLVALEAGWVVSDVDDVDDAISVAVSEAGKQLNPEKDYVEVELGYMNCPACGEPFDSVAVFGGKALVGLVFEITIYDVDSEDHAKKIATEEVGESVDVNLELAEIREVETE